MKATASSTAISPRWRLVSTPIRCALKRSASDPAHLLAESGEEARLPHHLFRVEDPALGEVACPEEAANRARVVLSRHQMPVVSGIGLVNGRGKAVVLEPLRDLGGRRAVEGEWDEEGPVIELEKGGGLW
jgi:hypothetical protein